MPGSFPQGGIAPDEDAEQAMYRELWEETGLRAECVGTQGNPDSWLRYRLPKRYSRRSNPRCMSQKLQRWFLLKLESEQASFDLGASQSPEFDHWKWVDY